jgi:hypothetical protein
MLGGLHGIRDHKAFDSALARTKGKQKGAGNLTCAQRIVQKLNQFKEKPYQLQSGILHHFLAFFGRLVVFAELVLLPHRMLYYVLRKSQAFPVFQEGHQLTTLLHTCG